MLRWQLGEGSSESLGCSYAKDELVQQEEVDWLKGVKPKGRAVLHLDWQPWQFNEQKWCACVSECVCA